MFQEQNTGNTFKMKLKIPLVKHNHYDGNQQRCPIWCKFVPLFVCLFVQMHNPFSCLMMGVCMTHVTCFVMQNIRMHTPPKKKIQGKEKEKRGQKKRKKEKDKTCTRTRGRYTAKGTKCLKGGRRSHHHRHPLQTITLPLSSSSSLALGFFFSVKEVFFLFFLLLLLFLHLVISTTRPLLMCVYFPPLMPCILIIPATPLLPEYEAAAPE